MILFLIRNLTNFYWKFMRYLSKTQIRRQDQGDSEILSNKLRTSNNLWYQIKLIKPTIEELSMLILTF